MMTGACTPRRAYAALLLAVAAASALTAAAAAARAHNFGPGPAALPLEVLQKAQAELLDFEGSGMSVLEWTNLDANAGKHPGVPAPGQKLQEMMLGTESKLRSVLEIPDDYAVLFMHGGAVGQFSAVPLNLLGAEGAKGDYVASGFWSTRAIAEAAKFGDVQEVARFDGDGGPRWKEWGAAAREGAAYLHVCLSETVQGFELKADPPADYEGPPIVIDATSTILSRPLDVSRYSLIFASGGKNVPAGIAVVIVRRALLQATKALPHTPAVLEYRIAAGALEPTASVFESRPNTPPTFAVYMLGLVLDHIATLGGLGEMSARAERRAASIYAAVDDSPGVFRNAVHPDARSRMNAVFALATREEEKDFLRVAEEEHGLLFLFGHPVNGGLRVTMYNWVTDEAVEAAAAYMREYAAGQSGAKANASKREL